MKFKVTIRQRRATLVDRMLNYFVVPRQSFGLHLQPEFADYTPAEVRTMLHALDRVGLVANVSVRQTRGSVYAITTKGRWLLEMKAT